MASIINATTTNGVTVQGDNSGSLQLATNNGTTAVTIDTSQNVGIGTTSPGVFGVSSGRLLNVVSTTNYAYLQLQGSAGNGGAIDFGDSTVRAAEIASLSGSDLAFYLNPTNSGNGLTERMRITSGGNLQFNSGYGSVATAYGCRAWVNFNGDTAGAPAINASGNVSSITDNGAGRYAINFTNAMPDANYGANVSVSGQPGVSDANFIVTDQNNTVRVNPTTSSFAITVFRYQGTPLDADFVRVSIFR